MDRLSWAQARVEGSDRHDGQEVALDMVGRGHVVQIAHQEAW